MRLFPYCFRRAVLFLGVDHGSRSSSCLRRRDKVGQAVDPWPAIVANAVEDDGSARFSSGVFRKNVKGFHVLRFSFMSCSFP